VERKWKRGNRHQKKSGRDWNELQHREINKERVARKGLTLGRADAEKVFPRKKSRSNPALQEGKMGGGIVQWEQMKQHQPFGDERSLQLQSCEARTAEELRSKAGEAAQRKRKNTKNERNEDPSQRPDVPQTRGEWGTEVVKYLNTTDGFLTMPAERKGETLNKGEPRKRERRTGIKKQKSFFKTNYAKSEKRNA